MCCNAGLGPTTPIHTVTPEQFNQVIGVNVEAYSGAFKQLRNNLKIRSWR